MKEQKNIKITFKEFLNESKKTDVIKDYIKNNYKFEKNIIDKISEYFNSLIDIYGESTTKRLLIEFLDIYDGSDSLYYAFERFSDSFAGVIEENPFQKNQ